MLRRLDWVCNEMSQKLVLHPAIACRRLAECAAASAAAFADVALAVSHHAEGASTQATSLAAEASKNAAAFAAQAVHFSNKDAEFVETARK